MANISRSFDFITLPVAVCGNSSTITTSSGSIHFGNCPASSVRNDGLVARYNPHDGQPAGVNPAQPRSNVTLDGFEKAVSEGLLGGTVAQLATIAEFNERRIS